MISSPITSWQIDGETMETVTKFIFGGSKITADGVCSHEIKNTFALWKKKYDQSRQHNKKQRYYFANKGPSSQSYGFSRSHVWMWSWTIKKAEWWRSDAFELLGKTLKSPLNCKEIKSINPKGNQSWIFIGRTDAEAENLCFAHLMQRIESLERTLALGKIEGRRRRGRQRMRWLDGITDSMDMNLRVVGGQESLACCSLWGHKE